MSPVSILYENEEILLINKPNGVSVQGGVGISHPLDETLSAQLGYKVHLVHRLDKETAGILIVAKNPAAASKWIKLIAGDDVSKEYYAVCIGVPEINGKKKNKGVLKGTVEAHGREQSAETFFEVEKTGMVSLPDSDIPPVELSLVHITLGTGRMHQIRIQMAKAGAPLAADDQHGNFKQNKVLRKCGIKKLQLAAVRLTIPLDGEKRTFEIPLPEHIQKAVNLLG